MVIEDYWNLTTMSKEGMGMSEVFTRQTKVLCPGGSSFTAIVSGLEDSKTGEESVLFATYDPGRKAINKVFAPNGKCFVRGDDGFWRPRK